MKKVCKTCGGTEFYLKDGKCKVCVRARVMAYRKANPEKVKEADKAKYKKFFAKISAKQAEDRKANPEKFRTKNAKFYKENITKAKADRKAYYASHADEAKIRMSKWHKKNVGVNRTYGQNRRSRLKNCGGKLSKDLPVKLLKLQKGKCPCCGSQLGDDFHLDHIMPLALGGSNTDDNMQLLHQRCNLQKHASHPVDFMQLRGFLL